MSFAFISNMTRSVVVSMCCVFISSTAMAATGDLLLTGVPASAAKGSTFVATFTLDAGAQVLGNYKVDLTFDSTVLKVTMIAGGTSTGFTAAPILDSTTPLDPPGNRINFGQVNASGNTTEPSGVVVLANITFEVIGDSGGTSAIGITPERIRDISFPSQAIATNTFQGLNFSVGTGTVARRSLTLTIDPVGSGVVAADPLPGTDGKYAGGAVVTLTASAGTGFDFESWTGDASGTTATTQVTMSADRSVTANFVDDPACTLIVSGGSTSLPATASTTAAFSVDVTADTCAWTVATSVGTTSVSGDIGDGTFTVTVPANTGTTARTITVTVTPGGNSSGAMETSITQAGAPSSCEVSVTGGSPSIPAAGGTTAEYMVDVTADTCAWTVATSVGTTSVSGDTGDGTFTVTVPANTGMSTRIITVVVTPVGNEAMAKSRTFTQSAEVGEGECEILNWYGGSYSIPSSEFTEELWVDMSSEECEWEFDSDTPGVEFFPASGTGDATVDVIVPANFGLDRVILITIKSIENEESNFFSNYIQDGSGSEGPGEVEIGCGCPPSKAAIVESLQKMWGDLFLVGMAIVTLVAFRTKRR